MFLRILQRSLTRRKTSIGVAAGAVLLGTALIAALLSLSLGLGPKVRGELQAYGANLILMPGSTLMETGAGGLDFGSVSQEAYIAETKLAPLAQPPLSSDVDYYLPYLYSVVEAGGRQVVLAGARLPETARANTWWRIEGDIPSMGSKDTSLVGVEAARVLSVSPGDTLQITSRGKPWTLRVSGIVESGGSEDSQVLVDLGLAQELAGRPGLVSLALVQASTAQRSLQQIAQDIQAQAPGVQVKVVEQVARAEARVLNKVQLLLGLVAALVLASSALAVFSTMTSSVMERMPEVGLMKALGAGPVQVGRLFLSEAVVTGGIAGTLGYALGVVLSELVARSVFDTFLGLQLLALPASVALGLAVTLIASALPVRRAMKIQPAITLKGE